MKTRPHEIARAVRFSTVTPNRLGVTAVLFCFETFHFRLLSPWGALSLRDLCVPIKILNGSREARRTLRNVGQLHVFVLSGGIVD